MPLGRGRDLETERGVECPGDLPEASDPDLVARATAAKKALGDRVFVLGHHYQRDEVIQFADVTGDSFKLARDAADRPEAEFMGSCGVHFMAESADILTADHQQVVLPDLAAGCSMADMARLPQVEDAWDAIRAAGVADSVVPVTYMNSSADIKGFVGRHDGVVCTSSNAETALEWAYDQKPDAKVLFLPDQHLGRNTAVLRMGLTLDDCVVWNPLQPGGGLTADQLRDARMILWQWPLLGPRSVLPGRGRRVARQHPRHPDPGPPRVRPRGRPQGGPGRVDRVHHQDHRGSAGRFQMGDRHRAQPGEAARSGPS